MRRASTPASDVLSRGESTASSSATTVHPFTGVDYVAYYVRPRSVRRAARRKSTWSSPTTPAPSCPTPRTCIVLRHPHPRAHRAPPPQGCGRGEGAAPWSDLMTAPGERQRVQRAATASWAANKATEDTVKLFPRDCQRPGGRDMHRAKRLAATGRAHRGHGLRRRAPTRTPWARSGSWPTRGLRPAYTAAWRATPNELKLKYAGGQRSAPIFPARRLRSAIREKIRPQGSRLSKGQMLLPGHHAPPPHRPHRHPLRPDLRLRRQGHPHRPHPGLFRQFCRVNRKSTPIRGWGCFSVAGLFARPAHIRAACPYSRPRISSAASAMYWASGFSGRPAMCAPHLATGMSTL